MSAGLWRVVDPEGVEHAVDVTPHAWRAWADHKPEARWQAEVGTHYSIERDARRAVANVALNAGIAIAEIRAPGERTTAEQLEAARAAREVVA